METKQVLVPCFDVLMFLCREKDPPSGSKIVAFREYPQVCSVQCTHEMLRTFSERGYVASGEIRVSRSWQQALSVEWGVNPYTEDARGVPRLAATPDLAIKKEIEKEKALV